MKIDFISLGSLMKNNSITSRGFLILLFFCSFVHASFKTTSEDFELKFSGKFRPDTYFGQNITLLNSSNEGTSIWFARHTLDLKLDLEYGQASYGRGVSEFYFDIRNRGIWGNPESIARTTSTATKIIDSIGREHSHAIPRHIFWMRAIWLKFELNEILGLPIDKSHVFKLGLFPFQLGRGIALGDAYATGPDVLGFYSDSVVDQYAPGILLSGNVIDTVSYDLYGALLRNRSTSLSETGEAILGQEYGRRDHPQRGSGKIDFLVATRVNWDVFDTDALGHLAVEPYALYNYDPEQNIEFTADSIGQLGTVGLYGQYDSQQFSIGFDYAVNLGQQKVKGWDRNQVREENRNGQVVLVNSHVVDQNGKRVPFTKGEAQKIIECSFQDESQNSGIIGETSGDVGFVSGPVILTNSNNRFRNPYTNEYEGWMFVIDAAAWSRNRDLRVAVATGIASGDENPNNETIDGVYSGFIGLQQVYWGDKVKSAFLLGGAGKLSRPLSEPTSVQLANQFSQNTSGFTNLVYVGSSILWEPNWTKKFSLQPNILAYWQEKPTKKFDAKTARQLDCLASTYLGTEINIYVDYMVLKDLNLFVVASIFFPGQHYSDIKGKPLNAAQKALLDRLDVTGFSEDRIPNIGDDTAYTFNLGLEFKF